VKRLVDEQCKDQQAVATSAVHQWRR
jgi:hypothetical protein